MHQGYDQLTLGNPLHFRKVMLSSPGKIFVQYTLQEQIMMEHTHIEGSIQKLVRKLKLQWLVTFWASYTVGSTVIKRKGCQSKQPCMQQKHYRLELDHAPLQSIFDTSSLPEALRI
jgi:hypothetical protein